eukprot:superscaffoldBa00001008_g8503
MSRQIRRLINQGRDQSSPLTDGEMEAGRWWRHFLSSSLTSSSTVNRKQKKTEADAYFTAPKIDGDTLFLIPSCLLLFSLPFILSLHPLSSLLFYPLALQQQEQDPTNLYISNLPVSMDEQELENMLKPLGHVISTRILRDANGVSRGVGFARMESTEKCEVVIQHFNGKYLKTPPGIPEHKACATAGGGAVAEKDSLPVGILTKATVESMNPWYLGTTPAALHRISLQLSVPPPGTTPTEPLLCKFADGGQKKRQSQSKYPQNGRPWHREGETGMALTYDPAAMQNGFYSSPYSIATNRMIAQTSITPFIAASPVSTYQGAVITPAMDHTMSMQPASMMGPLTQQMNHLSLGTTGSYMTAAAAAAPMQGTYIPQYTPVPPTAVPVEGVVTDASPQTVAPSSQEVAGQQQQMQVDSAADHVPAYSYQSK